MIEQQPEKVLTAQDFMRNVGVIETTRATASEIVRSVLLQIEGKSEIHTRNLLQRGCSAHPELFAGGWYSPPPGGIAVLFAYEPYTRMQFETLRDKKFWPGKDRYTQESLGLVYMSPVDIKTGMLGDIGLSFYQGSDERVRRHLKTVYEAVLAVAGHAEVSMRMNELYSFAQHQFTTNGLKVGYMTTAHDPLKINLGHTAPGSYANGVPRGGTFEKTKEAIRSGRLYINEAEEFQIPTTCAFTVEARLIDVDGKMPNVFFHVIVTFVDGEKKILTNFDDIFKSVGMSYML
jgi:hypothetical protein